ncbi:MAG: hypothetical protein IV108_11740 [Burkholderiales bacterium]|nr:hypothetical protein [Burkholderiales bacterium]
MHRQYFAGSVATALALATASCVSANTTASQTTVHIFKSAGTVQCAGGGDDLPTLARQLEEAGLKVRSSACGSDGRMRAAMCGVSDGRIVIFELSSDDAQSSSKLGFAPLGNLPEAKVVPCR